MTTRLSPTSNSRDDIATNATDITTNATGLTTVAYVKADVAADLKAAVQTNAALGGDGSGHFAPQRIVVHLLTLTGGALNGDAQITVGTSAGGTQILGATALTGLDAADDVFIIDLTGHFDAILDNATLHVEVTSIDSGGATGTTTTVTIEGRIV